MTDPSFEFYYQDQCYQASAKELPSNNGYRCYKIFFPNVQSITEGSVDLHEAQDGEWEIRKIMSADPVHEEFLHQVAEGFVEYIDNC